MAPAAASLRQRANPRREGRAVPSGPWGVARRGEIEGPEVAVVSTGDLVLGGSCGSPVLGSDQRRGWLETAGRCAQRRDPAGSVWWREGKEAAAPRMNALFLNRKTCSNKWDKSTWSSILKLPSCSQPWISWWTLYIHYKTVSSFSYLNMSTELIQARYDCQEKKKIVKTVLSFSHSSMRFLTLHFAGSWNKVAR